MLFYFYLKIIFSRHRLLMFIIRKYNFVYNTSYLKYKSIILFSIKKYFLSLLIFIFIKDVVVYFILFYLSCPLSIKHYTSPGHKRYLYILPLRGEKGEILTDIYHTLRNLTLKL